MHPSEDGTASQPLQRVLHDAESLMTRYVHDGEALAREVGKDLRGLLDDIVKVVPPEEAERVNADKQQAAVPVEEKSAADATTEKPASQPHTLDDPDDFAWDDDDEEDMVKNTESSTAVAQAGPTHVETGPRCDAKDAPTVSPGTDSGNTAAAAAPLHPHTASEVPPERPTQSEEPSTASTPARATTDHDSDSDWE